MSKWHRVWRVAACISFSAALTFIVLAASKPAETVLAAPPRFIVDKDGDDGGGGACTDGTPNDCSLRSAIRIALSGGGYAEIYFQGSRTIVLTGSLPALTGTGTSIIAFPLTQTVKINGNSAVQNIFRISGSYVTVKGLRLYGSGSPWSNIWITGSARGIEIANNVIGDDDPSPGGCGNSSQSYSGIYIDSTGPILAPDERAWIYGNVIECHRGSPGNGIDIIDTNQVHIGVDPFGNSGPAQRNHIRLNDSYGIFVTGTNAAGHVIAASYIGVNDTGAAEAANGSGGIYLRDMANTTVITGNLVSGNSGIGVLLDNTRYVTLTNNFIGTNAAGTAAIPNHFDGVAIINGAMNNWVGGFTPGSRNILSGNGLAGVYISGASTSNNVVDFNIIGLNASGAAALPNGTGVEINGAHDNNIGTSLVGVLQLISGNINQGISIAGANSTFIGQTNLIGLAADGAAPLGNGREGVRLENASDTTVLASRIVANGRAGVAVTGTLATGNKISPGRIYGNGGLPIDLGDNGPTPNDPGDGDTGPNALLNYPVMTAASGNVITGTACISCSVYVYQAIGNPAAPGGGGIYLDEVTANASGVFTATLPAGYTRLSVSLVACAAPCFFIGNTSEFSPRPQTFLPAVLRN